MKFLRRLIVGCAAFAALGLAYTASANSILLSSPNATVVTDNGNGTYTYKYLVSVDSGNEVRTGDFFTIYDFQGLISVDKSNLISPTDFSVASIPVGITPLSYALNPLSPPAANDSAFLPNITVTYTGSSPIVANSGDPVSLGYLLATTSVGTKSFDTFVAQDHMIGSTGPSANTGTTAVPFDSHGPFITPTPMAASGGVGLIGLLTFGRRRRQNAK